MLREKRKSGFGEEMLMCGYFSASDGTNARTCIIVILDKVKFLRADMITIYRNEGLSHHLSVLTSIYPILASLLHHG